MIISCVDVLPTLMVDRLELVGGCSRGLAGLHLWLGRCLASTVGVTSSCWSLTVITLWLVEGPYRAKIPSVRPLAACTAITLSGRRMPSVRTLAASFAVITLWLCRLGALWMCRCVHTKPPPKGCTPYDVHTTHDPHSHSRTSPGGADAFARGMKVDHSRYFLPPSTGTSPVAGR